MTNIVRNLDAKGTVWTRNLEEDDFTQSDLEEQVTEFKNSFLKKNFEEPWKGSFKKATFDIEEMYVDTWKDTSLVVSGDLDGLYISLDIPLDLELDGFLDDVAKAGGVDRTGLFFNHDEFEEVVPATVGKDGRVTLGREYAGEDVKLVVVKR